jgi:hypothetical protein
MYDKVGTRKFTQKINKLINTFTQGNTSKFALQSPINKLSQTKSL